MIVYVLTKWNKAWSSYHCRQPMLTVIDSCLVFYSMFWAYNKYGSHIHTKLSTLNHLQNLKCQNIKNQSHKCKTSSKTNLEGASYHFNKLNLSHHAALPVLNQISLLPPTVVTLGRWNSDSYFAIDWKLWSRRNSWN